MDFFCSSMSFRAIISLAILSLSGNVHTQESPKNQFCAQAYFDSVLFDGDKFIFVVSKQLNRGKARVIDQFTALYDDKTGDFFNFTHIRRTDDLILQGGLNLSPISLYLEFYYRDPIGYSNSEQLDFNAYEYLYRSHQVKSGKNISSNVTRVVGPNHSNSKLFNRLFSPQILTAYTAKHRLYFFDQSSSLIWIVLHQDPTYYGWIEEFKSAKSNYRDKWTFKQEMVNSPVRRFYTGIFPLNRHIYLVEEQISEFGFRYPSIVRQVVNLKEFTFYEDTKESLNKFFGCTPIEGLSAFQSDPDQGAHSLKLAMIIVTLIFAAILLFAILLAIILYLDSNKVIQRLSSGDIMKIAKTPGK